MPPATITFIKLRALLEHRAELQAHTSEGIKQQHWLKHKSISKLLPDDAFLTVEWELLPCIKYAVMSYSWRQATWGDLLTALEARPGLLKLLWIDVFCLNQSGTVDIMYTIKESSNIYAQAAQYHVLGFRTFDRGWHRSLSRVAEAQRQLLGALGWELVTSWRRRKACHSARAHSPRQVPERVWIRNCGAHHLPYGVPQGRPRQASRRDLLRQSERAGGAPTQVQGQQCAHSPSLPELHTCSLM